MNLALTPHDENTSLAEFESRIEPDSDFETHVRDLCGLFVSTHDGHFFLLHQTARTFLLGKTLPMQKEYQSQIRPSKLDCWQGSITIRNAHAVLAKICIKHTLFWYSRMGSCRTDMKEPVTKRKYPEKVLLFAQRRRDRETLRQLTHDNPRLSLLFRYCCTRWAYHVKGSSEAGDIRMVNRCIRLLDKEYELPNPRLNMGTRIRPLVYAAVEDLAYVFKAILDSYHAELASSPGLKILQDVEQSYYFGSIDCLRYLNSQGLEVGGWPQQVFSEKFWGIRSGPSRIHAGLDGGADPDFRAVSGPSWRQKIISEKNWLFLAVLDFREKLGLRTEDWERHEHWFELRYGKLPEKVREMDYEAYKLFFLRIQRQIMEAEGRKPLETYDPVST